MNLFGRTSLPAEALPDSIYHDGLGARVVVTVRANSRSFTARWHNGVVRCSCPPGVTRVDLIRALDAMAPRLLKRRPTLSYSLDTPVEMPGFTIRFAPGRPASRRLQATIGTAEATIAVPPALDLAAAETVIAASALIRRIAARVAPAILLPEAAGIAAGIGVSPARWEISSGLRVLGRCSVARVIALSSAVLFLPLDLRRYIVCHELAHLTEMNHSPRFHAICDAYCGGREKALAAALRRFSWPVLR